MTEPKAVLWDLDGTILDTLSVFEDVITELFPRHGLKALNREEIRREFYGSIEDAMARLSGNYHDQASLLTDFFEAQLHHYENPTTHHGIQDTIHFFHARGLKQAIVTSRDGRGGGLTSPDAIIRTLKHELHISVIISGEDSPHHKPHPEPIRLALEKLGVTPQNAVMIGDQSVDVTAGKAAGTKCILIDHEQTPESHAAAILCKPDAICHDADEIRSSVKHLLGV